MKIWMMLLKSMIIFAMVELNSQNSKPVRSKATKAVKETIKRNGLTRTGILIFVFLPTILTVIYLSVFASDMYTSVTKVALQSENSQTLPGMELASSFLGSFGSSNTYAFIIQDYIHSAAMLQELDKQLNLWDHYSNPQYDLVFRLPAKTSQERFVKYWNRMVDAKFETDSGIISVSVKAFTPAMAKSIGEAILVQSEKLVNHMNERAQQDTLLRAYDEVKLAEQRVANIRQELTEFRDTHTMLDARASAESFQGLLSHLEGQAIEARVKLKQSLTYFHENSPQVRALQLDLEAIEKQLAEEKARVAGQRQEGERMSSVMAEYEQLAVENEFAQKQYISALSSLEIARVQAGAKSQYIVAYQHPTLPDEPRFPRPLYHSFLVFVISWMLFFIVSFIVAAIREHSGF